MSLLKNILALALSLLYVLLYPLSALRKGCAWVLDKKLRDTWAYKRTVFVTDWLHW